MRSGKKIGIMGGTFNPIHNGHLQLAMAAQDQVSLDQILFMPSGNSYMKEMFWKHRRGLTWWHWR